MRIASLQPSVTLTLHALGKLDTLCAVTKYCLQALPELAARNIPVLHDSWTADTDEILATHPDLVVASVPYRMESLAAILKSGLPVLAFAPHNLADIYNDIRLIGGVVEACDQAESLIRLMQQTIAATREKVAFAPTRSVYCEEWGKPMIHSQPWVAELIEAAGGTFIGAPGTHTTPEEVADADPDTLLFAWCGAGNRVPLAKVVVQRNWQPLRAVRSGSVFCIPDEYLNTPAPTLLEGLACIASAIHPELFPRHRQLVALTPND
ncbi:ABC transporter substrate-binding protein [Granulicella arctica]|uniref:ABC transporter substrate-binding protein n=1 Tax=Granulicella arctica TaxID=940613 RepID=UPI0021DFB6E1|nr:ABC transporter substrate-binding protein [Granulicella arctica]